MPKTKNVSVAKPKITGAIYRAPLKTALPADATTALNVAFKELGYVGEDGVTNNNSAGSDNIKSWGGAVVATTQKEKNDTFKFKLIEALNTDVLATVYGSGNVSGVLATGIKVSANAKELESAEYVIEIILRNGIAKRIVIPEGKISEVGEITYKDDELIAYEITVTALPDDDGNTHYEYIKETAA